MFFLLKSPLAGALDELELHFDFDIDAGRKVEIHEGIDGFGGGIGEIDEALVGSHFELLAGVFVDMRAAKYGCDIALGGERNRSGNGSAGTDCGFNNLFGTLVDDLGVIGLKTDTNTLLTLGCGCGHGGTIFRSY